MCSIARYSDRRVVESCMYIMKRHVFRTFLSCNEVMDNNVLKFVFYLFGSGDVVDLGKKTMHMLVIDDTKLSHIIPELL